MVTCNHAEPQMEIFGAWTSKYQSQLLFGGSDLFSWLIKTRSPLPKICRYHWMLFSLLIGCSGNSLEKKAMAALGVRTRELRLRLRSLPLRHRRFVTSLRFTRPGRYRVMGQMTQILMKKTIFLIESMNLALCDASTWIKWGLAAAPGWRRIFCQFCRLMWWKWSSKRGMYATNSRLLTWWRPRWGENVPSGMVLQLQLGLLDSKTFRLSSRVDNVDNLR